MKKFKDFLSEEMMPYAQTEKGFVGVDNGPVRDNINIHLASVTARSHATPYHAMEMVRKVLAPFSIFPPQTNFLDGDSGHEVFPIKQFGDKMGMTSDGTVVVKNYDPYYVYFEYQMNDMGSFDIFCEIVEESELQEILDDIEGEMENEETTTGDEDDASDSFDEYKSNNDLNEDYDSVRKAEAGDANAITKRARNPKEKKKWSKAHKDLSKDAVEGRIDEVSQKAATDAYAAANDPGYYHPKADDILKHIRRKFGKEAKRGAENHAYADHFGRDTPKPGKDSLSGGLRSGTYGQITKSGKIPKGTQKAMKNKMDPKKWQGYGRKVGGPKGLLPEETELNELHGKSKEAMKLIKKRIEKKHDAEWEATYEKRKKEKLKGGEKTKKEDKSRNDLAKRWLRADKAEKKLKEDYPGVQRRSNKSLDPDLQKDFKDYKSDQQAKHSSNSVKMSWQNSPNPTFKTMGMVKPWQSTDSRAKYDATRDKVVDKQNQREIRRDPPITVKESTPPWRIKGEKPSGESKTPDAESKSRIKKITKRLAKIGMAKKK